MISPQPETVEVSIQLFTIFSGPLTTGVVDTNWSYSLYAHPPVNDILFRSSTSDLASNLADTVQVPEWIGTVMKAIGQIALILGIIGWFVSPTYNSRRRGFQLAASGFVLTILGFGFAAFQNLISYVLTG